jgi:SAM-dependent methyltransferase
MTAKAMNIREYNRDAWDREVKKSNRWTLPVDCDTIAKARRADWQIVLTPTIPVPADWFPQIKGADVLCLASGGGQQGPVLAAAGAEVTVLDNSPLQLEQDRFVAERDGLHIRLVEGDMANLGMFDSMSYDLIVHPVSNTFVPDVRPVWREAFRVLRQGGILLAGFMNPAAYLVDYELAESTGILQVMYRIPYSDLRDLPEDERKRRQEQREPMEFSHTLDDQIGGQLAAGFIITGFYEDRTPPSKEEPLTVYMPNCMATRAIKP